MRIPKYKIEIFTHGTYVNTIFYLNMNIKQLKNKVNLSGHGFAERVTCSNVEYLRKNVFIRLI